MINSLSKYIYSKNYIYHAFKVYLIFAIYYHGYWYFFPKNPYSVSLAPYYVLITKDIMWILFMYLFAMYYLGNRGFVKKYETQDSYRIFLLIITIFVILYVTIILLHSYHKSNFDLIQHEIRNILGYLPIVYLCPFIITSDEEINNILELIIVNGALIALFGLLTKLFGIQKMMWSGNRVISTLGNPNNLGLFLTISILLSLSRIIHFNNAKKYYIYCFIMILCLVGTISLTSFAGLIFGILSLLLFNKKYYRIKKFKMIIISIFVLIIIAFNFNLLGDVKMKLAHVRDPDNKVLTLKRRVDNLEEIYNYLKNDSIVNVMLGDFQLKSYRRYDSQYWNFIRNDGIIIAAYMTLIFAGVIIIGFRKSSELFMNGNVTMGANLSALTTILLTVMVVNMNGTAFLNRYPLNFILYLFIGLIMVVKSKNVKLIKDENFTQVNENQPPR